MLRGLLGRLLHHLRLGLRVGLRLRLGLLDLFLLGFLLRLFQLRLFDLFLHRLRLGQHDLRRRNIRRGQRQVRDRQQLSQIGFGRWWRRCRIRRCGHLWRRRRCRHRHQLQHDRGGRRGRRLGVVPHDEAAEAGAGVQQEDGGECPAPAGDATVLLPAMACCQQHRARSLAAAVMWSIAARAPRGWTARFPGRPARP